MSTLRLGFHRVMPYASLLIAALWPLASASSLVAEPGDLARRAVAIMEAHCFRCHSGERPKSHLRLTSRGTILAGGDDGPVIDPEQPTASLLLAAIRYEQLEMPPAGKLAESEIAALTEWVRAGVPFPAELEAEVASKMAASRLSEHKDQATSLRQPPAVDSREARDWWSYQPIVRPPVPLVKRAEWVRNPIDAFILAGLESASLTPAEPASPQQLVRRANYDLTGLPPSPQDVAAVSTDHTDQVDRRAYVAMIERLLNQPAYGEKWARHWLDLARYAESNGYERDGEKPQAWRYRDYVVRALNTDKPYDRFVLEQLAGDELAPHSDDAIIATGFQRLGLWDDEPVDADAAYFDALDDVVSTTAQVFLGMTLGCARCHDHKLDPILQSDYYSFVAFFRNTLCDINRGEFKDAPFTLNTLRPLAGPSAELEAYRAAAQEARTQVAELLPAIDDYEREIAARFTSAERQDAEFADRRITLLEQKRESVLTRSELKAYLALLQQRDELQPGPPPSALCVVENDGSPPPTYVLSRGNVHAPGAEVAPATPLVLGFNAPAIQNDGAKTSGRRLALARWMVDPRNPLTARVMVNRIWQHHFGRGMVASSSDFGRAGERPTHPELLDWLAAEFRDSGWSIKHIHRLIMYSNTYQMSAHAPDSVARDPQNVLCGRFNLRRLTAEELYDTILSVCGRLDLRVGGPSVQPPLPPEVLSTSSLPDAAWGQPDEQSTRRRAIYVRVRRSLRPPLLAAFDTADTDASCPVRFATTVPTQALQLLNSQFLADHAAYLSRRLQTDCPHDLAAQLRLLTALTTGRQATDAELAGDLAFVHELIEQFGQPENAALQHACSVALNANEFLYVD